MSDGRGKVEESSQCVAHGSSAVTEALTPILVTLGLVAEGETPVLTPLTGGVSSEIVLVTREGGQRFCVKRALSRLKVAALWEVPIGRNDAEAEWIDVVGRWLPDCVPRLLARDRAHGLFAMDYLPPDLFPVWKEDLLARRIDEDFAASVGTALAVIHDCSIREPALARSFAHDETFEAIRLEPYLRATALAHPDLASRLIALADRTLATKLTLMHGDVSPKNILHGPKGPIFLDAECACWGDPAFDLAFCLNHLLLKAVARPAWRAGYLGCFSALTESYKAGVGWEAVAALDARCASLLPALLLARIDGKSPVEYLDEAQRALVRDRARAMLLDPPATLADLADRWTRTDA